MLFHFCRYMSMAVVHDGNECVLLALGCSDGAVRCFDFCDFKDMN